VNGLMATFSNHSGAIWLIAPSGLKESITEELNSIL
jgi:hypothetical protein